MRVFWRASLILVSIVFLVSAFAGPARAFDVADDGDSGREPASAGSPLSPDDQRILQRGEMSQGRYIAGGITGSAAGFGIGHAVQGQGRYREIGWVFTAGESASVTLLFVGILSCFGDPPPGQTCTPPAGLIVGGLVGLLGFHIWETIDLWVVPPRQNRRYRELQAAGHGKKTVDDFRIYPTLAERSPGLGLSFTF